MFFKVQGKPFEGFLLFMVCLLIILDTQAAEDLEIMTLNFYLQASCTDVIGSV